MSDMTEELQTEIRFWEYMANEYQDRQSLPEYGRITRALALAEDRLEKQLTSGTNSGSWRKKYWFK